MAYSRPVVVMGVSGSGKTTVGAALAELSTLERPAPDEHALTVDIAAPVTELVGSLAERMTDD